MSLSSLQYDFASESRIHRSDTQLLEIKGNSISHHILSDLPDLLPNGSLIVINDSATIPASLIGTTEDGDFIELRLMFNCTNYSSISSWVAIAFGIGDWTMPTENRAPAPELIRNSIVKFGNLIGKIRWVHSKSSRIFCIEFLGTEHHIWSELYNVAQPIQYSHLSKKLNIWDVQTIFATKPVSVEPPSAAFQFTWDLVNRLEQNGHKIIPITHATSISSTGDTYLDTFLPYKEQYWISVRSASLLRQYLKYDRPIVAVGTSVTRSLESNFKDFGTIRSGNFTTNLLIDQLHKNKVITHLFTGMHLPEESHFNLLKCFVSEDLLIMAYKSAVSHNYLWHEYGDVSLIHSQRPN